MIGQFSTLLISIDAPLRMLLEDQNANQFIPRKLLKRNDKGAYTNGILMVACLSGLIAVVQMFGSGAATVMRQLTKLGGVTMPLRYLWVFVAYFALKKNREDLDRGYTFVKSKGFGMFIGAWCFVITLACCIMGMWSPDKIQMALNIATPVIIVVLGLLLPVIRKNEDKKFLS